MANRSWFFASEGKQQGPYPEAQFRNLIARGAIGPDTLVWTEGMANWQRAGDIPGLLSGAAPPTVPQAGGAGGALSLDVGVWPLLGRTLLYVIGMLLVIPAPWTATGFYRWMASRIRVPGRPKLAFEGMPGDIWYVFILMPLVQYAGEADRRFQLLTIAISAFLTWMVVRWVAANLSSNGQRLPMSFAGSVWGFIGWQLLLVISFITIIGWAWVVTAYTRWICSNIEGTRREIVFNASGLEVLWRTLVLVIGCVLIIPIPWALRWYTQWYVSQFALVGRGGYAAA